MSGGFRSGSGFGGRLDASYPSDVRPGAGISVDKAGLAARVSIDLRKTQRLTTIPASGLVPVQDPSTGMVGALPITALPTAQTGDGTQTNAKLATMPARTIKANLLGSAAFPQDVSVLQLREALGITDGGGAATTAANVSVVPPGSQSYSTVQGAITSLEGRVSSGGGPTTAANVSVVPPSGQSYNTVQAAITSLEGRSGSGPGGPITADKISDGSASGRVVLTGTPEQGRAALLAPFLNDARFVTLTDFGADPSGIAFSDAALDAAIAALPDIGGRIRIGCGRFKFASRREYTLKAVGQSITLAGAGQSNTVLVWPSANGGLKFNYPSARCELNMSDLTVATGADGGGGEGVCLQLLESSAGGAGFGINTLNTFSRITTRGDQRRPFSRQYWNKGIATHGVSFINFNDCTHAGGAESESSTIRYGIGVSLEGAGFAGPSPAPTQGYGVLFNFTQGQFNCCDIGLYYGSYIQGVTITNYNAVYCRSGIATVQKADNPADSDLAQLYVNNFQYGLGTGNAIELNAVLFTLAMVNCTAFVKAGKTGVYMPFCVPFKIANCTFQGETYDVPGSVIPSNSTGVYCGPSLIEGGSIIGSDFSSLALGINCAGSRISGQDLAFNNTPSTILDNGQRNLWGTNLTAHSFIPGVVSGSLPPVVIPPLNSLPNAGSRGLQFKATNSNATVIGTIALDAQGNLLFTAANANGSVNAGAIAKFTQALQAAAGLEVTGNLGVSGPTVLQNVTTGAVNVNGSLAVGGSVGFFGRTVTGKRQITGRLSDGSALSSLLQALDDGYGLIDRSQVSF